MAIKRYYATLDNTITNAYKTDMNTRGTASNMGASDILEVFSLYGLQNSQSSELSRILIQFPISKIQTDRSASTIPASGNVDFYLRLFNAKHSQTLPRSYNLIIAPVEKSWSEGTGLDMETYADIGQSNWIRSDSSTNWTNEGGDYTQNNGFSFSASFDIGNEDLEVNISPLVERWANDGGNVLDSKPNYGVGVFLTPAIEATDSSYYTKKFFGRGTEFFFKRPCIEARWNSSKKDDRTNFYYSSSLAPADDNVNTLYLYNYIRGVLRDIPSIGTEPIYVSFYSGSDDNSEASGQAASSSAATRAAIELPETLPRNWVTDKNPYVVTGAWVETGIYSASFAITGAAAPLTKIFDVWHDGSGKNNPWASTEFATSSFRPTNFSASQTIRKPVYYLNITNLRDKYRNDETARFNLFVREKYWDPTVYTVANTAVESTTIQSASYRVFRVVDSYEAIPYGTGSDIPTGLSYDISGNYFDFDMGLLEPGYAYGFKFSFYDPSLKSWTEQRQVFKFRVEDYEY